MPPPLILECLGSTFLRPKNQGRIHIFPAKKLPSSKTYSPFKYLDACVWHLCTIQHPFPWSNPLWFAKSKKTQNYLFFILFRTEIPVHCLHFLWPSPSISNGRLGIGYPGKQVLLLSHHHLWKAPHLEQHNGLNGFHEDQNNLILISISFPLSFMIKASYLVDVKIDCEDEIIFVLFSPLPFHGSGPFKFFIIHYLGSIYMRDMSANQCRHQMFGLRTCNINSLLQFHCLQCGLHLKQRGGF